MASKILTDEIKRSVELLYIGGKTNVSEIAGLLKVPRQNVYAWIKGQPWYKQVKLSRLKKQLELLDASFSEADFSGDCRKDSPYNVILPFQVPSLNEYIATINHNKNTGNRFKSEVEGRMIPFIRKAFPQGFRGFSCKVQVHITFYEATEKRDWDNIISSEKFIFDALQTAGVIERDDQAHLLPPTHSFERAEKPHAVVTVYPHPEFPVAQKKNRKEALKRPKKEDTWRDMYGEEEIRTAYRLSKDKKAQYRIFRDFGVPKDELDRILGL